MRYKLHEETGHAIAGQNALAYVSRTRGRWACVVLTLLLGGPFCVCAWAEEPLEITIHRESSKTFEITILNTPKAVGNGPGGAIVFIPELSLARCLSMSGVDVGTIKTDTVMQTTDWDSAIRGVEEIERFIDAAEIVQILMEASDAAAQLLQISCKLEVAYLGIPPNAAKLALAYGKSLDQAIVANNARLIEETIGDLLIDQDTTKPGGKGVTLQGGQRYVMRLTATSVNPSRCYLRCKLGYRYLDGVPSGIVTPDWLFKLDLRRKLDPKAVSVSVGMAEGEYGTEDYSEQELQKLRNSKKPDDKIEPVPPPVITGQIQVLVYDKDSRDQQKPAIDCIVEGADIMLSKAGVVVPPHKPTDDIGSCTFEDLPLGTYTVSVSARGYERSQPQDVVLDKVHPTRPLEIGLKKASKGQVKVHVYDRDATESGTPTEQSVIKGASVVLFGAGDVIVSPNNSNTDAIGVCVLGDYPFGSYRVTVNYPGYEPQSETFSLDASVGSGWRTMGLRKSPTPSDRGKLDVVFCIDVSGSMMDDIQAVQKESVETLTKLSDYAAANNISLQVGLVTYTRHDEPAWLHADTLTTDVASLRDHINAIKITNGGLGKGGNEDTYGVAMYAMNQTVGGQQIDMGWRTGGDKGAAVTSQNPASTGTPIDLGDRAGAAKIIITMGDEPQDDPDWEGRKLEDVARVAKDLDPVHMYPILLPKEGSGFLNSAVAAKRRIARATGGELIQVNKAADLPEALVSTLKLAVRQHKAEVWRKAHPPYLLYAMAAALGLVTIVTLACVFVMQFRQQEDTDGVSR